MKKVDFMQNEVRGTEKSGSKLNNGRWDPDSLRPALSLGGQASAWEGSPGRSLCLVM